MKVSFRQGLLDYQTDGFGNPQYLVQSTTSGYVDLNVAPTPCVVTFAHGSSDYLQVFNTYVPGAWGPVPVGATSYLYWDIDLLTSNVSYDFTTLEPVAASTAPSSPPAPNGKAVFHWFDTTSTTMKVWNGSKWQSVVRVFAGKAINSTANISFEPRGTSWKGVLPVEGKPGYISTDIFGNPLRTPAGEFVTSSTPVRFKNTVGTSGVLAVLPNAFIPVRASENIPAMSLVYFSGEGTVGLASGNPSAIPSKFPIGVVQEALGVNEVGTVTQYGEISYDQWDWSAHIGKPLYCGDSGQIVTARPPALLAYRVGFVKNAKTILFQIDAETFPQVYQADASDIVVEGITPVVSSFTMSGISERVWSVSIPAASSATAGHMTAAQAAQLATHEARLDTAEADILGRALLVHAHTIAQVTGLQAALDGKAAVSHNHNLLYSPLGHNHNGYHALVVHSHTIPDVAGLQTELNGKAALVHGHAIADVTGLQAALDSRSPTGHGHTIADVTGLQAALDDKSPSGHGHAIADVTGLQPALDGKLNKVPSATTGNFARFSIDGIEDAGVSASSFAFINHTHTISQVSSLQAALDGKSPTGHGHAIVDVAGLQAALDGRSPTGHGHAIVDVAGLQAALDGRSPTGHVHSMDSLTDADTSTVPPAIGDVLTWNGTNWVPEAIEQAAKVVKPAPLTQVTISVTGDYSYGSALHHNLHVRVSSTDDVTITISPDSEWTGTDEYFDSNYNPADPGPMPTGGVMLFGKHGVGNVIFTAGVGVTINTPDSLSISRLHGKATLIKVAENVWDLEGNIGT